MSYHHTAIVASQLNNVICLNIHYLTVIQTHWTNWMENEDRTWNEKLFLAIEIHQLCCLLYVCVWLAHVVISSSCCLNNGIVIRCHSQDPRNWSKQSIKILCLLLLLLLLISLVIQSTKLLNNGPCKSPSSIGFNVFTFGFDAHCISTIPNSDSHQTAKASDINQFELRSVEYHLW